MLVGLIQFIESLNKKKNRGCNGEHNLSGPFLSLSPSLTLALTLTLLSPLLPWSPDNGVLRVMLVLQCCDKITELTKIKVERFNLAGDFRSVMMWEIDSRFWDVVTQCIILERHGGLSVCIYSPSGG